MSNLYSGAVQASDEYKNLSEISELTFIQGTTYTIEILNLAYVREGEIGKGFLINNERFEWIARTDALYIYVPYGQVSINIAD